MSPIDLYFRREGRFYNIFKCASKEEPSIGGLKVNDFLKYQHGHLLLAQQHVCFYPHLRTKLPKYYNTRAQNALSLGKQTSRHPQSGNHEHK
jgi:hypothetical protein